MGGAGRARRRGPPGGRAPTGEEGEGEGFSWADNPLLGRISNGESGRNEIMTDCNDTGGRVSKSNTFFNWMSCQSNLISK